MENRASEEGTSSVKLTFRQKAFLDKVLDLYHEMRAPLRYSLVADRLGVSKSTAYDMLRLLERKGLVTAEYALPKETSGPGRSNVVFFPTAQATEVFSQLTEGISGEEEWEEVKVRMLNGLRQGKASEYNNLLRDLLAMIPEARSPLVCCAEITTALLVSLKEAKYNLVPDSPVGILLSTSSSKLGMGMLTGLAAGFMLADKVGRRFFPRFEQYVERYARSLDQLRPETLEILHNYTHELMGILATREG
ncbi:MAG: helix-turn-helix domain-containing protein [Dehalococcoidia bacterium]|nr:helix-turn-helix domain-containing protein [Dehalococcoidia bacterium]